MKDRFNDYEGENSNSEPKKEDSDKILSDNDFESLYVSDEIFLKLISEFIKRMKDNQQ